MVVFGAKLRTLAIASALLGLVPAQANACAIGQTVNVFFDHVPEDIDGFVVLEATLVESHSLIDKTQAWMLMGRARIDKIIKGEIDGKTVKLFRYTGDPCGMHASGKTRGIVIGTIRKGTQNELEVLTEFQWSTRAQAFRARASEEPKEWRAPDWAPWQKEWQGPEWVPWPGLSRPTTPQQ